MVSMLPWDATAEDVRQVERDDARAELAEMARELDEDARGGELERGWSSCECGARSPNVHCPVCRRRLRPPGSAGEVRWMRNHGYEPTATDLRRFPDDDGQEVMEL